MKPKPGRRASHATIVAYLALFVALGGTATALSGRNSVFSDDIAPRNVKAGDPDCNAFLTGVDASPAEILHSHFGGSPPYGTVYTTTGSPEGTNYPVYAGWLTFPATPGSHTYSLQYQETLGSGVPVCTFSN